MTTSVESRHRDLVARLEELRRTYLTCVEGVAPEVAHRGSEWSISDLLNHLNGGYYRTMAKRLLEEEHPDFGGTAYDPTAGPWQRAVDRSLAAIEEALSTAVALTPEQMVRTGTLRGREVTPLDALDDWANHLDEHPKQLRDEIRPREGLS